jgi:hypothetical protein
MRKRLKELISRQNEAGRLLWVPPLWASLRNLQYYPVRRHVHLLKYLHKIALTPYRPLKLDSGSKTAVFYLCVGEKDGRKTVLKLPRLDNRHAHAFARAMRNKSEFERYSALLTLLPKDENLGKHVPDVHSVQRGGGYESTLVEGHNLLSLRDQVRDTRSLDAGIRSSELLRAIDELLNSLNAERLRSGTAKGDWALQNLIYEISTRRIKNVDLEGFFTYGRGDLEATTDFVAAELTSLKHLVELTDESDPKTEKVLKALSAVGHATKTGESYSGRAFTAGYHSVEIAGRYFRGQRECSMRLAQVPYDFSDKVVLDLGCASGGMLHCLSDRIQEGIGVDANPGLINAANLIKDINNSRNLRFYTFDLDRQDLTFLADFLLHPQVDVCFLLSMCLWLDNWRGVIDWASKTAGALLIETNGSELQQRAQRDYVRLRYPKVTLISATSPDDPGQKKRALLLCEEP